MAEDDQKDRNLPPRDFADALVDDPANPPQLQIITGYRGRSAQEGSTRFYTDLVLSAWVDVPNDAILFQREIKDEIGLSKSLAWTRLDAQIQAGPQTGGGTGAEFLQGQVAQDLGGGAGGIGGFGTTLRTPLIPCPTQPPICIRPTLNPICIPSVLQPCPPQTVNPPCVLQTANPEQCPSLGITCTALPPCPPRTVNPEQCPTLGITCTALPPCPPRTVPPACQPTPGIACIPSVLIACPPITQDPNQCVLQTANPQQCPSLGITCTALPPCPPRTANPEQCPSLGITCTALPPCPPVPPPSPFIGCMPSVLIACPPATQIPQLCEFRTLSPQLCGLQTTDLAQCTPKPSSNPQFCPVATPNAVCIPGFPGGPGGPLTPQIPDTASGPRCEPVSSFCPTVACPTIPPNQGFGGFGQGAQGFQGAEAMGVAAVAGPGPAVPQTPACPSQLAACTQLCPAPNTTQLTCPVTHNVQCFTSRMCPRSTFCPSVSVPCHTGAVCQPVTLGCPFGGGGGVGGGF